MYFNPRSHEGSDCTARTNETTWSISIHAPTKGATPELLEAVDDSLISIHAPTKGATSKL